MQSSLEVTGAGPPLGLAAAKFWIRKKFKGTNALKKKINPTRVPIDKESIRWLDNVRQSAKLLGDSGRCNCRAIPTGSCRTLRAYSEGRGALGAAGKRLAALTHDEVTAAYRR